MFRRDKNGGGDSGTRALFQNAADVFDVYVHKTVKVSRDTPLRSQ